MCIVPTYTFVTAFTGSILHPARPLPNPRATYRHNIRVCVLPKSRCRQELKDFSTDRTAIYYRTIPLPAVRKSRHLSVSMTIFFLKMPTLFGGPSRLLRSQLVRHITVYILQ